MPLRITDGDRDTIIPDGHPDDVLAQHYRPQLRSTRLLPPMEPARNTPARLSRTERLRLTMVLWLVAATVIAGVGVAWLGRW